MRKLAGYDGSALQYTPGREVRVLLAFHVTRLDVAKTILRGNLAELSKLDPGCHVFFLCLAKATFNTTF
jgi:hypothetical protein